MKRDPYGTAPMFDEIPDAPVATAYADVSGGFGRITYTRYKAKQTNPCDDCKAAFITNPKAPASRPASHKRAQAGTNTLYLCHLHVQLRKDAEA